MNKKAIEISMNTIVIAAIALIVLVVVIAIFTGTIENIAERFNDQTDKAGEKGDQAMDQIDLFRTTGEDDTS